MTEAAQRIAARFAYVARQRSPLVKIVCADEASAATRVHLECGHSYRGASHFTYRPGDEAPCFDCGKVKTRALPEFAGKEV